MTYEEINRKLLEYQAERKALAQKMLPDGCIILVNNEHQKYKWDGLLKTNNMEREVVASPFIDDGKTFIMDTSHLSCGIVKIQ